MSVARARTRAKRRTKQFLEDAEGRRTWVLLPIEGYDDLVEAAEQREDIRRLDEGKRLAGDDAPLEQFEAQLRGEGRLA